MINLVGIKITYLLTYLLTYLVISSKGEVLGRRLLGSYMLYAEYVFYLYCMRMDLKTNFSLGKKLPTFFQNATCHPSVL